MQSFLQYRRFGRHVRRQYERDQEKAQALGQHDAESPSSLHASRPSNLTLNDNADSRDLEKGEEYHGVNSEGVITGGLASLPPSRPNTPPHERLGEDEEMNRVTTRATQRSFGTNIGVAMTGVEVRKRTTKEGGDQGDNVFVVGYEGEADKLNPHNWTFATRISATMVIASIGWVVGFASSVDSAALPQAAADFGVSEVTETLATGLFLIGFGCGALFAGPISETIGRNPVYIATLSLYMIFVLASGLAPNIGAQLAFRFLAGFFGSTPLTCAGGSISDLWSPMERVYAFPIFANAAFLGPIFGPVVGGFVGQSARLSWRWCEWLTLIISAVVLGLVVLLQWKASQLRAVTGDARYRAAVEIRDESFGRRLRTALYRPFLLTATEPIIILVALYLTIIYIILFTFLTGYTFIFSQPYHFSQGTTGLAFLGIALGLCAASLLVPLLSRRARRDLARIKHHGGTRLPPEFRLWFGMLGAPAIPIALFWMGWTARAGVSCWAPLLASVVFGYGILCVFISCYQYIIDSYEGFAASALASVTLIRYVAAGGMVEVAIPMYSKLGVHWTLTILGAISALLVPVPYLFYFYGTKIRAKSKFAVAY